MFIHMVLRKTTWHGESNSKGLLELVGWDQLFFFNERVNGVRKYGILHPKD